MPKLFFFLYRNGAVTYQIILSFFPSALLQLHFLIYDQNWSWMFLFPSERLNNVEPQKMVNSKSIRVPRERLLRPWFHSPLSRYQSSLMSRKTWYIFMVWHVDGLYGSLCVLWSFYIPVIQRWSSCYSNHEMKKCFYFLIQFGHHFWLKCILWTIALTFRKFVFFFHFFSFFGKYSLFQIIAITWFIYIDRTRASTYLACQQLLIISSSAEAFLCKHEA